MTELEQYDCLLDLVKKRRTIRRFRPDPVPDEYITRIIEVARWAPSGFHTQPWEFAVVRNRDVKDRIIGALERKAPAIKDPAKGPAGTDDYRNAPVFIFLLCDWRARVGLPGMPSGITEQVKSIYTSSMANAFLYMHLAAAALGLASQWYTAASRPGVEDDIKEIIGIPEELSIYDMMVVGYAAAKPGPKIIRDTGEMVHYDDCGIRDFRTDEEVRAYAEATRAWCLAEH
jgi:nitroreductase